LVDQQQVSVDVIDSHVVEAKENVTLGHEELVKVIT